jgi:DNA-binding NtrC family response regulator
VFIDKVGIADTRVQMRLLRELQERRYARVGGDRKVTADVRIVVATNVDLQYRCAPDSFVGTSTTDCTWCPSNCRRCANVEKMWRCWHSASCAVNSRVRTCRIDAEALALLRAYPRPGNIRELENTLERVAVLGGPLLTACDVPPEIVRCRQHRDPDELCELGAVSYRGAHEWFDRRFFCGALRRQNGALTHGAGAIGICATTCTHGSIVSESTSTVFAPAIERRSK